MTLPAGGMLMTLGGIPVAGLNELTADYGVMNMAEKFALADFRLFGSGFLFAMAWVFGVFASHNRELVVVHTRLAILWAICIAVFQIQRRGTAAG